ncbi:Ubiquitin carboxyl-terminal hydrolase MINDY-1, partial [Quaeritorhiza haematococci]
MSSPTPTPLKRDPSLPVSDATPPQTTTSASSSSSSLVLDAAVPTAPTSIEGIENAGVVAMHMTKSTTVEIPAVGGPIVNNEGVEGELGSLVGEEGLGMGGGGAKEVEVDGAGAVVPGVGVEAGLGDQSEVGVGRNSEEATLMEQGAVITTVSETGVDSSGPVLSVAPQVDNVTTLPVVDTSLSDPSHLSGTSLPIATSDTAQTVSGDVQSVTPTVPPTETTAREGTQVVDGYGESDVQQVVSAGVGEGEEEKTEIHGIASGIAAIQLQVNSEQIPADTPPPTTAAGVNLPPPLPPSQPQPHPPQDEPPTTQQPDSLSQQPQQPQQQPQQPHHPQQSSLAVDTNPEPRSGGRSRHTTAEPEKEYVLKPIEWADLKTGEVRKLKIITQNLNGPCPLLALCNVLLLRGDISLPYELTTVTYEYLVDILGDLLFQRSPQVRTPPSAPSLISSTEEALANFQQNLQDVLSVMPTLQKGLDVNVRFDSPYSFELTPSLLVFDMFGISLCHGWTVDPQDEETYRVVVREVGSYNGVVERVIAGQIAAEEMRAGQGGDDVEARKKREKLVHEGLVCEHFLNATASQLTVHGLQLLSETLPPASLSVLFRNNHFSLLFKR